MKKWIVYGCIAAVVVVALVVFISLYGQADNTHAIKLPPPAAESGNTSQDDGINRLEVSSETVQSVLGTLTRVESFSRIYRINTYWDGGQSASTLKIWQKGENILMNISQDNTIKNILVRGSELYVWYDGTEGVFHSRLSDSGLKTDVDRFSRLVTYEDIYEVPLENILDAGYEEQLGQPCIYAEYKSGDNNYVNQLYVSINTGLLVSTKIFDGEKLIYSMESDSTDVSTPSDDIFAVPS